MKTKIFIILRILIGTLFIASGFEKLIGPYQNFLYVVQSYECFNPLINEAVARIVPWFELLLGMFTLLGLWLNVSLRALFCLNIMFILIVAQAMIRGLPITECGCFGEFMSFPLYAIILFDSALLVLMGLLIKNDKRTSEFSIDRYFNA